MIYTSTNLSGHEVFIEPDLNWHSFEMIVDFKTLKWVSITIDGVKEGLCDIDGAKVRHDDWGDAFFLGITTESQSAYPQPECELIFTWTTQFKNQTPGMTPRAWNYSLLQIKIGCFVEPVILMVIVKWMMKPYYTTEGSINH